MDWRHWMRNGAGELDPNHPSGQMRGFHIVFRLRIAEAGMLRFWSDGGCVVRRGGRVLYEHRGGGVWPGRVPVEEGDVLEVAQWNGGGDWYWAAQFEHARYALVPPAADALMEYLGAIYRRLARPNGPPLKFYCNGQEPVRTALALYSMVLNGYAPSAVLVYGSEQWDHRARSFFGRVLPFVTVVPQEEVLGPIRGLGAEGERVAAWARDRFFVMKLCVALLCPPYEHCLMDDDVFVLRPVDDALAAFRDHDLVYQSDGVAGGPEYLDMWGWMMGDARPAVLPTANFNFGQYWMRNAFDPLDIVARAARVEPPERRIWVWDQGFVACLFAGGRTWALPSRRYLFPFLDGLPGGSTFGYDYENNPCGFTSIHFAAFQRKPSDAAAALLIRRILGDPEALVP
jgi:hypothetical protein